MVRWLGFIVSVVLMFVPNSCQAQRSDTVWQTLVLNTVNTTLPWNSPLVNNIGQGNHTAYLYSTECGNQMLGGFQYSWDATNYYSFGTQLGNAGAGVSLNPPVLVTATGAYPYVRVRLSNISTPVSCHVSVYYSGTIQATNVQVAGPSAINTGSDFSTPTSISNPVNGLYGAAFITNSSSNQVLSIPNVIAIDPVAVAVPVGTTFLLGGGSSPTRWYIDNIVLTADTNATVIVMKEGKNANCASNPTFLGTFTLNAGIPLTIPKIRTMVLNDSFCISATVGSVSGTLNAGAVLSTLTGY